MIVRIGGGEQYELDDRARQDLESLDRELTQALHAKDEHAFHELLKQLIAYIREHGTELRDDRVVPSDVIVPPEDVSLDEAGSYFTDDTHLEPLPA